MSRQIIVQQCEQAYLQTKMSKHQNIEDDWAQSKIRARPKSLNIEGEHNIEQLNERESLEFFHKC